VLSSVTARGYLGRGSASPYADEVDPRTRRAVTLGVLLISLVIVVIAAWRGR